MEYAMYYGVTKQLLPPVDVEMTLLINYNQLIIMLDVINRIIPNLSNWFLD